MTEYAPGDLESVPETSTVLQDHLPSLHPAQNRQAVKYQGAGPLQSNSMRLHGEGRQTRRPGPQLRPGSQVIPGGIPHHTLRLPALRRAKAEEGPGLSPGLREKHGQSVKGTPSPLHRPVKVPGRVGFPV